MSHNSINTTVFWVFMVINSIAFGATTSPEPYSFSMDRFVCQTENPPISAVVDEFNDGVLDPTLWEIFDPTVIESGEVVTFQSPGEIVEAVPGILTSWTYIGSNFTMTPDMGSFMCSSTWLPDIPQANQFYSMGLSLHDPLSGIEIAEIGISIINLGDPVLAPDVFGIPPGLSVWFSRHTETGGLLQSQFLSIDESDITGDIILHLGFDDVTQSFNAVFSLNGGLTTLTPFNPDVTGPIDFGNWSFGAESFVAVSDSDSDGLPDYWETLYGLDPADPSDAVSDLDQDGLTALEEYTAGTQPDNPDSDADGRIDGADSDPLVAAPNLCGGDDVVLINDVYANGTVFDCRAQISIQTDGTVTVESGADVLYMAPVLRLITGFSVEAGGVFHAVGAIDVAP